VVLESYMHNPEKHQALKDSVQELLLKNVLAKVSSPESPGFYGRLFIRPKPDGSIRPKPDGSWRKIIDLSGLNDFINNPTFRMETVMGVQRGLRKGMWVTSIDLSDAYYHIPIHRRFRKYFRIALLGEVYCFQSMPMGLNVAARIFTKVIGEFIKSLRQEGIHIQAYLDDWLLKSFDPDLLRRQTVRVVEMAEFLGLVVNPAKSELVPTQRTEYVGVDFDLVEGFARAPLQRLLDIHQMIASFIQREGASARGWYSLLGKMGSVMYQIKLGPLHRRPIQHLLHSQWTQREDNWDQWIPLLPEVGHHLLWWMNLDNTRRGVSLLPFKPSLTLFTDASLWGFGASLGDLNVSGPWSPPERTLHSNNRELLAVYKAVVAFQGHLVNQHLLVCSDNTTTVASINKQGGTKSWSLTDLVWELWILLDRLNCQVVARHIPGRLNVMADLLSRSNQVIPSEWMLKSSVLDQVWVKWGRPEVDLFATHLNNRLVDFVSPFPHPQAWGVDAFSLDWGGRLVYIFPPWVILQDVLWKIWDNQAEAIVVAPAWPSRPWYPLLLQLSVEDPFPLPVQPDLLVQPVTGLLHHNLHILNLQAWRLSGRH
jgi:hypothetical protein